MSLAPEAVPYADVHELSLTEVNWGGLSFINQQATETTRLLRIKEEGKNTYVHTTAIYPGEQQQGWLDTRPARSPIPKEELRFQDAVFQNPSNGKQFITQYYFAVQP